MNTNKLCYRDLYGNITSDVCVVVFYESEGGCRLQGFQIYFSWKLKTNSQKESIHTPQKEIMGRIIWTKEKKEYF